LANKLGRGFSGVRRQRRRRVCCIEMSLTITLHAWWLQLGPSANPQTRGSNPDPDPSPFPIQLPFLSRYLPRGTWAEDKWAAVLDLLDCLFKFFVKFEGNFKIFGLIHSVNNIFYLIQTYFLP